MIRNDEHWIALTDTIQLSALGTHGWGPALEGIAEATGSRTGQLIGIGSNATVPFNLMTNADPEFAPAFAQMGGGNPSLNPRVGFGSSVPVLRILSESDYLTEDQYYRHPFLREVTAAWGYAFSCLTPLERRDGMLFGLAVLRTEREGHVSSSQREAFAALAPHMRAAVRTQLALESQGAELLAGALDKLSIAAFICDRHGYVRKLTPAAERILADGTILQLRANRLHAARACDSQALANAMAAPSAVRRTGGDLPALRSIVVRSVWEVETPLVLDVIDVPSTHPELGYGRFTLVIARGESQGDLRKAAVVRAAYELSMAETEVALQLCKGLNADAIAKRRRVSVGTVRAQIKKISAKLGVKSQIELVARINRL